jgi:hypothetical protein
MRAAAFTMALLCAALFPPALGAGGNPAFAPDAPPLLARITVSEPDARHEVTVSGAAGATLPNAWLSLIDVDTGHHTIAQAAADGSFSARLIAPAGTSIQIKADPFGRILPRLADALSSENSFGALPGTLVRVPEPPGKFAGAGANNGYWFTAEGTMEKTSFRAGEIMSVTASVTVHAAAQPTAGTIELGLARITTADGHELTKANTFASAILTPTALPIERTGCGNTTFASVRSLQPATLSFTIPASLGAGLYQPHLTFAFHGLPPQSPGGLGVDSAFRRHHPGSVTLPLIRIGEPAAPRLFAALFADTWSQGTLGVRAIEDRTRYAIASHIAMQSDVVVLPRGRHRVEPHLPLVSLSDRGTIVSPPRIPFRFPSGSLTVRIERPDGSATTIGPAPFAQPRFITPARADGRSFDDGSRHPADFYQASTMDPRFETGFDRYGRHRILLDGSIDDVHGNTWRIAGTYEVLIAEPLLLDTAVLPGTPFEAGDRVSLAVTAIPPVPARIETTFAGITTVQTANRFGFARPFHDVVVATPGEYRIDVTGTYTDRNGVLYAGARTWGGVIAPKNGDLTAHGQRGLIAQTEPRLAWYLQSMVQGVGPASHPFMPFFGGDVVWAGQPTQNAMITAITIQDTKGDVAALMSARCGDPRTFPLGEGRLLSSRADGLDAHLDPATTDLWSYGYASVQRPLVRVREIIAEHEIANFGYWQFTERYGAQLGVGDFGDETNDIKFLFGGAVVRGSALPKPEYAIYGALWVHLPHDDPAGTRVMPPFRGNGGGPDGGPIMRLKGREIDLFFHPTAIRAGTILTRGAIGSFTGHVAPPLPAKVTITVTAPSGRTQTIAGEANLIGWFNRDATFIADEAGVWRAKVGVLFDGRTSAGQVAEPFPAGGVLGSRDGEFFFYVIDGDEQQLAVTASENRSFEVMRPAGLRDTELHYTAVMPGFILEEGSTRQLRYVYDADALRQQFPNLDRGEIVTISLVLSGTDASGKRRHFARQLALIGDELHMPDQPPRAKRRAAR